MSAFQPAFCPHSGCPGHQPRPGFRCHRIGFYARLVDGRRVQRFRCLLCRRRFSAQSFRLDYRQVNPLCNGAILTLMVSKVTHRQTARMLHVDRKTVHRRLRLWGPALRELHDALLDQRRRRGGLSGLFSLDELETYEHERRLKPVTMPVLIHRDTRFIVHLEVGQLPARGGLQGRDLERKKLQGPRPSESTIMVRRCLESLKDVHDPNARLHLVTDQKRTYQSEVRVLFANRVAYHATESSKSARNTSNPLFPINHTLATLRDHVSRLVRRTWAASKLRCQLLHHAWIFAVWKNYARGVTNQRRRQTPGMILRLIDRKLSLADLLRWRWPRLSIFAV